MPEYGQFYDVEIQGHSLSQGHCKDSAGIIVLLGIFLNGLLLFVQYTFCFHCYNWYSFTCCQILVVLKYYPIISCAKS